MKRILLIAILAMMQLRLPAQSAQKPQTPIPPFPYKTEDTVYFNKDKTIRYGATITIPEGNGPFPAVILITGSGQQNRDEQIGPHKPFAVIADHLTRKGFVVLRVDDRGMGKSTGELMRATSLDFCGDVGVGIDYLKTRKETDTKRIALIGHSEGGMIAQMLAAQRTDVAAIVLLAGPGTTGKQVLLEQNRAFYSAAGIQEDYVARYMELYSALVDNANQANKDSIKMMVTRQVEDWIQKTPEDIVKTTTRITDEKTKAAFIGQFSGLLSLPWVRYFLNYDPKEYLEKISCPVFALNGSKDIQVISKSNLPAIEAALKKSRSKDYKIKEYDGLNHLFQQCKTCTTTEYASLDETISVEVLADVAAWLTAKLRR